MSDLMKFLEMDWKNGFLFIASLIVVAIFIIQKWDWIVERFGLTSKRQLEKQKQDNDINELKDHVKESETSFNKIFNSIDELKASVKELSDHVTNLQKKNDDAERNRLRDRIGQAYRYYAERGQWNSMEKEAFNGLVESYEAAGGINGFVHEKAVPASCEWKVIDE